VDSNPFSGYDQGAATVLYRAKRFSVYNGGIAGFILKRITRVYSYSRGEETLSRFLEKVYSVIPSVNLTGKNLLFYPCWSVWITG
jgi:hypothetical protein